MADYGKWSEEEIRAMCQEAMADKAVTNVSGWTEPNTDQECDEGEYRRRLAQNGDVLNRKLAEALRFE